MSHLFACFWYDVKNPHSNGIANHKSGVPREEACNLAFGFFHLGSFSVQDFDSSGLQHLTNHSLVEGTGIVSLHINWPLSFYNERTSRTCSYIFLILQLLLGEGEDAHINYLHMRRGRNTSPRRDHIASAWFPPWNRPSIFSPLSFCINCLLSTECWTSRSVHISFL